MEHTPRHTSGSYIRTWRTNLNLSYETVAYELGVDVRTVRNWEASKSVKRYVRLAFDRVFRDTPSFSPQLPRQPKAWEV